MPNNRARGRNGENEAAALLGGERISRTGQSGSDIIDGDGKTWECKRIRSWDKRTKGWMVQAKKQGDFGIIARADREGWFVIIPLENHLEGTEND